MMNNPYQNNNMKNKVKKSCNKYMNKKKKL